MTKGEAIELAPACIRIPKSINRDPERREKYIDEIKDRLYRPNIKQRFTYAEVEDSSDEE